jgi:hypothetical protein
VRSNKTQEAPKLNTILADAYCVDLAVPSAPEVWWTVLSENRRNTTTGAHLWCFEMNVGGRSELENSSIRSRSTIYNSVE